MKNLDSSVNSLVIEEFTTLIVLLLRPVQVVLTGPEVIKLFFMLSSAETEIYPVHKC